MKSLRIRSDGKASDGFIVVAVLWILGALATLASIYALYVSETAAAFRGHNDRLQAQALATAGVELAVYQLTANPSRGSRDQVAFRMGGANVLVDYRAESARIDLNVASKEILAGLFTTLGARRADAENIADRIVAWRSPPPPAGGVDMEPTHYRTAGKTYGPRHAPFPHVNEIALVAGLSPVLIDRALPYLTVYSGRAEISVLDAAPEVLAALPDMTPARLQALLEQRVTVAPDDLKALQDFLGPSARYVTIEPSKSVRMTIDVRFDANRRVRSEAVVLLLQGDAEPYRVLSWRDDIEEPSTDPRRTTTLR